MRSPLLRLLGTGLFAVLALLSAGCNTPLAPSAAARATPAPRPTHQAQRALPGPGCRPAGTDGNGGPYPAARSSDCTGSGTVEVDLIADPKLGGGFAPSNITVRRGTRVAFVWRDDGHNLYPWHAAIEPVGTRVVRAFPAAGTFAYSCQLHPGMAGRITVV